MARMTKIKLQDLTKYNIICVTGGEPMLNPVKTLNTILNIKDLGHNPKMYMYTALYDDRIAYILKEIDGIHYTLHENSSLKDIQNFMEFQNMVADFKVNGYNKSCRVYVNAGIKYPVSIVPNIWSRVETKKWELEDDLIKIQPFGIPVNEDLLLLDEDDYGY